MRKEIINLKDYFEHHYDDWGRLYCVKLKGNPLELENSIKRLQAENEELKEKNDRYSLYIKEERDNNYNYLKALEEIREFINNCKKETCNECEFASTDFCTGADCFEFETEILNRISEVLK